MKILSGILFAAISSCCLSTASAQTTVVTQPYFSFNDQTQLEPIVVEERNGGKVVSAKLDLCIQNFVDSSFDRVVIDLKPQGETLSGDGVSQLTKTPVAFSYAHQIKGNELNYIGTLTIGKVAVPFVVERVIEKTRQEYLEGDYTQPLVEQPGDFTSVSPQWLAIKVKRGKMAAVLQRLRGQDGTLNTLFGLTEDCAALRTDTQTITFLTHPDRAARLLPEMRKWDGVAAAGWGNTVWMFYAVRLAARDWSAGGKLDRAKLAAALERSVRRVVGGTTSSAQWDETSGDLVLNYDRDSSKYRGLGFTEKVEVRILVAFERPGNAGDVVTWVNLASAKLADQSKGARLKLQPFAELGSEGIFVDQDSIALAIAKDLKGVNWNAQTEKWFDR